MNQFAFLDNAPVTLEDFRIERLIADRKRYEEVRRECLKHNLSRAFDYAEAALDHSAELQRAGHDTSTELDEAETLLKAFLVQVMALRRAGSENNG